MVRAAIVAFALTPSFAEDVYYHTQLLQTKMNPQKVAVSADADVKDDMVLFQKTFKLSKKTVSEKFMAALKAKKARQGPGGPQPDFGAPPPEAAEECKVYYGDGVDIQKCWTCSMTAFMSCDEAAWHPDPNPAMKGLCDQIDGCMGTTNLLTSKCEGEYGPEVGLFDCMMCGMMCECESPADCDLECHRGCMQMDEEHWEEEKDWDSSFSSTSDGGDHDECYEHCKAFYGPESDYDKCMAAGEVCFPKAMEATPQSEKNFFDTMLGCCDEEMGETNGVTKICQEHYGKDVEVFDCFACGMACGCEPDKAEECDGECHYACMTEDWLAGMDDSGWSSTSSDWGDSSWSDSSWSDKSAFLKKQAPLLKMHGDKMKAKKQSGDTTGDSNDLMQTSKHLKK